MFEILLILFLALLVFGGVLWPVRKLAEVWHAERTGYGPAAVAIGATIVAGLLTQIFLAQMFAPLVLVIVSLAVDAWIFSFLLGLSLLRGLLLTIIINILATLLVVLLFLLLYGLGLGGRLVSDGMSVFSDGEQQYNSIEAYADGVCDCGSDKACLQERYAEIIFMVAREMERNPESDAEDQLERAQRCVNIANRGGSRPTNQRDAAPKTAPAFSVDAVPTATTPSATTAATLAPAVAKVTPPITRITRAHKARWYFEKVPMASADQYLNRRVRVTRADNGKVIQGRLMPSKRSSSISLEQQRYGGVFVMHIPKSQIRSLEIRNISQQ